MPHHEGMPVGGSLGRDLGRDRAARARPVVHQHRLAPALGEFLADHAREVIGRAAHALAHDAQRPLREVARRIGLGERGDGQDDRGGEHESARRAGRGGVGTVHAGA
ncbi:MAG: hypothetical protein ACK55I_30455, partial [bacterium]